MNPLIARVIRCTWWVSVAWLSLTLIAELYYFAQWLTDKNNPGRYEYAIASGLILIYSFPAAGGVLLAGVVPETSISRNRRVSGILLLLFCIGIDILFDYLQARYR